MAVLVGLVILFYQVENWRGERALRRYVQEWEAKGERFDAAAFIPPPVPDDQNFAMTPMLAGLFRESSATGTNSPQAGVGSKSPISLYRKDRPVGPTNGGGAYLRGVPTDLKAWQEYYRAPVLKPGSGEAGSTGGRTYAMDPELARRYGLVLGNQPARAPEILTNAPREFPIGIEPQTPAKDVLLALSRYDAQFDELHQAIRRPYSRFPINYADRDPDFILLPHLSIVKSLVLPTRLRAIAKLEAGDIDGAFADAMLAMRLGDTTKDEPFLISFLVRIACHSIALQSVWEGMWKQKWTEPQLRAFQDYFEGTDFVAGLRQALRGGRALDARLLPRLVERHSIWRPADQKYKDDWPSDLQGRLISLMPRGGICQNLIHLYRNYAILISLTPGADKDEADAMAIDILKRRYSPYYALAAVVAPYWSGGLKRCQSVQAYTHLATLSCALERYRLAKGVYPMRLDELQPDFIQRLPIDFMSGEPFRYRRSEDGRFVLYSVGEDRKDNGGAFPPEPGTTSRAKPESDWVWRYPAAGAGEGAGASMDMR